MNPRKTRHAHNHHGAGPARVGPVCAGLVLAAIGVLGCRGGKEERILPAVAEVGPVLVDPNEPATWQIQHTFVFRNPSTRHAATLEVADKSCGCTQCFVDPPVVPPGQTARVELRVGVGGEVQRREEAVTLRTYLPELPEVRYVLVAHVYPRLAARPDGDITLQVPAGGQATANLVVEAYQPVAEEQYPFRLHTLHNRLRMEAAGPPATEAANGIRRVRFECQLHAACPDFEDQGFGDGAFSGMIEIGYGPWQLRRNVFWRAEGAVRAWPTPLLLTPQNRQGASAVLYVDASKPFALRRVSASSPALVSSAQRGMKSQHHQIAVCWQGKAPESPLEEHRITVEIEGLRQRVVHVPVYVLW